VTDTGAGNAGPPDPGLALPPTPDAAFIARRYIRTRLDALGRTDLEDTLALAASELVTNAAIHAGTPLVVRLEAGPSGTVRLSVSDTSSALPRQRHRPPTSTTGRGLTILEALGTFGVDPEPDFSGKTVWFEPFPVSVDGMT
jgi:anti-sigma regulatory factor (Ser/Thr protein kinase)